MSRLNIAELEHSSVIHFSTDGERFNAYILASTLVGLADAAKAANAAVNLGYDIEIVVEAIGPGSFRAQLRALYKESRNLFSTESLRAIVLGIVASFIYERARSVDHSMKVTVETNEVAIESGNDKILIHPGWIPIRRRSSLREVSLRGSALIRGMTKYACGHRAVRSSNYQGHLGT